MTESNNEIKNEFFHCFETTVTQKEYHIYLSGTIDQPEHYTELLHKIRTAGKNDIIYIYLNLSGGLLKTGVQIIGAMKSSEAYIITSAEGEMYSLAPLIFLAGDDFMVSDGSLFMFHNYSSESFGKGNEQRVQVNAIFSWYEKIFRGLTLGFFTDEEIDQLFQGKDFWMDSEEVRRRLHGVVRSAPREMNLNRSTKLKIKSAPGSR